MKRKEQKEKLELESKKAHLTPQRDGNYSSFKPHSSHHDERKRHYREQGDETPSSGGGVNSTARNAIKERERKSRRVNYVSSKDKDPRHSRYNEEDQSPSYDNRDRRRGYDEHRKRHRDQRHARDRDRDSERSDRHRGDSYRRSNYGSSRRSDGSIRFKDEPLTPALSMANTPRLDSWDDDDAGMLSKRSSQWDYPTPRTGDGKREDETPLPTPSHKFNPWVRLPGSSRTIETPGFVKEEMGTEREGEVQVDREEWEDEQKRLDREWYSIDEGYDDAHNPFSSVSDEYTKKKEDQLAQRKKQRMSAQQRQINKDNDLWERNRMLTSGVVLSLEHDDDFEEVNEARVHLLVHHIVPPFLDGRIVFTKQFEPVVPVRVSLIIFYSRLLFAFIF